MKNNGEKISAVPMRGMRDLLPEEVALRQSIIKKIKEVYTSYGFSEIETPIVERSELLSTGEGGDNEKQTFSIMKRGQSLDDIKNSSSISDIVDGGLRFDLTVPLARYYANNHAQLPSPFKVMQIGNVFRAERPQKGRYRQFTQCDIDIIGDESTLAERELILATSEALARIGFSDFLVRVNDRRILKGIVEYCGYDENERELVLVIVDKLDKVGLDGVETELTEKIPRPEQNSKMTALLREIMDKGENSDLFEILPPDIDAEVISQLRDLLTTANNQSEGKFRVNFDPTLVRGMGYYTGPIFEITDKDFPSSIAGGGRYDKMIGKYSSHDVPACGFSIGFERTISLLVERGIKPESDIVKKAVIFNADNVSEEFALNLSKIARQDGSIVITEKQKKNTKKQLDDLLVSGYGSFCLIDSEDDIPEFKEMK